jgi:hypothetical protein
MKKNILIFLILFFAICVFAWTYFNRNKNVPITLPTPTEKSFTESPLISKKISELGLKATEFSTYMILSPENNYIVFGGIEPKGFTNYMYLGDVKTGEIRELEGNPIGTWTREDMLITASEEGLHIYNPKDGTQRLIKTDPNVYTGSVSPNGKWFAFNSQTGVQLLDISAGTITKLSDKKYDGAYAWFSDSKRILGYKENPLDDIGEAGKGRLLAIWNTETKSADTNLGIDMPSSSLRFTEWVVEDHIARVNAGYDDGSFDYLVDLDRKFVTDLGETSGMLMNGVRVDPKLNMIALVGMEYKEGNTQSKNIATLYNKDGKVTQRYEYKDKLVRQSVQIINDHQLLYLRKDEGNTSQTDVVLFDFDNLNEKVLYHSNTNTSTLLLSKDKKTFILATKDTIVAKDLLSSEEASVPPQSPKITTGNVTFKDPGSLPFKYIGDQEWPPQVSVLSNLYTCKVAPLVQSKTVKRTINGKEYCIKSQSEGAAGSTYTTYQYTTARSGKTIVIDFVLRYIQCGNYDEPNMTECKTELASSEQIIDTIIDRLTESIIIN